MNDKNLELVADIVSAYVQNNAVPLSELSSLISQVNAALTTLGQPAVEPESKPVPAVNPKKSVFPDYLISLENGKQFKSLKRHLSTLGMSPAEYREKWGLARDYPMVATSYAAKRSELARSLGLGRKRAAAQPEPTEPKTPAKAKRPRTKKTAEVA